MFERFAVEARVVVTRAQVEARRFGHGYVGCEHLLYAATASDTAAGVVLRGLGITPEAVESTVQRLLAESVGGLDRDALAHIGIDLDLVTERVEAAFGPGALTRERQRRGRWRRRRCYTDVPPAGHLRFTPRAKVCLERSLREARVGGGHQVGVEHLVLALAWMTDGVAPRILARLAVPPARVRAAVQDRYRRAG